MSGTYRIKGHLPTSTSTVEFDDAVVFIDYPDSQTWVADILLEPTRTNYPYRFIKDGIGSSWHTLTIQYTGDTLEYRAANNSLDKFGVLLDLKRNTEETNEDYRTRLKDVFVNRGGPQYDGILNGLLRELGLPNEVEALTIYPAENVRTGGRWSDVNIRFSSYSARVTCGAFNIYREEVWVDPYDLHVVPTKTIYDGLLVETKDGRRLDPSLYKIDEDHNRLWILDISLADDQLFLTYQYEEVISRDGLNLTQLSSALEAIQTPNGDTILEATVASGYGDYDAMGIGMTWYFNPLIRRVDSLGIIKEGYPVRWSPIQLNQLWDREYQDAAKDPDGALWNTKIASYGLGLRKLSKATWGVAVADESIWSSKDIPLEGGHFLDTNYDIQLQGVLASDLLSGVGGVVDLKIVAENSTHEDGEEEESHVVSTVDETIQVPTGSNPDEGGTETP